MISSGKECSPNVFGIFEGLVFKSSEHFLFLALEIIIAERGLGVEQDFVLLLIIGDLFSAISKEGVIEFIGGTAKTGGSALGEFWSKSAILQQIYKKIVHAR